MKKFLFGLLVAIFAIGTARAVNNCTGATYYDSDSDTCISCPVGYDYNTDAGKTSVTQCQIHCDAGEWNGSYTRLEYIESTGTQYIDTNVDGLDTGDWEIYVKWMVTDVSDRDYAIVVSGYDNEDSNAYRIILNLTDPDAYRISGNSRAGTSPAVYNVAENTIHEGLIRDNSVTIDNVAHSTPTKGDTISSDKTILLFGNRNGGIVGRIYASWATQDGIYKYNFVPVRRNRDGVLGMYDLVTNTFFTNSGTGTFVAGPVVGGQCDEVGMGYYAAASTVNYGTIGTRNVCPAGTYSNDPNATSVNSCAQCTGATYSAAGAAVCTECPAGYDYNTEPGKTDFTQCQIHCDGGTYVMANSADYIELEYIESTGEQYIDTGINGLNTGDWEIYVKWMVTDAPSHNYAGVVSAYANEDSNTYRIILNLTNPDSYYVSGNSKARGGSVRVDNIAENAIHEGLIRAGSVTIDNVTYSTTNQGTTIPANKNILLFGNSGGGIVGRIYGSWATQDGVYKYDYVPVRRNSDGALGMYDKVSGQFFTDANSRSFISGPGVGGACTDVGAGYWAAASTVNYGSSGTRNACPVPTTTVGYGHGADEANDCGRMLHLDNYVIYTRRNKETTPAVNIRIIETGDMFYAGLSPTNHTVSRVHLMYNGQQYTAYDDSLLYGERDFDTGLKITQ